MSIMRPNQNERIYLGHYETTTNSAVINVSDADSGTVTLNINSQAFTRNDLKELIGLLTEFKEILE